MSKSQYRGRGRPVRQSRPSWLPLALIAGGVLILGGVLWAAFGGRLGGSKVPVEVTGAPRLKVDQLKVDLGNIKLGQTVEVNFQLSNVGDQPLRFTEAPFIEVAEGC